MGPPGTFTETYEGPVNVLVLRGHGQTVLVDAGSGPLISIWPGATAWPVPAEPDVLIATHLDWDHFGGFVAGRVARRARARVPGQARARACGSGGRRAGRRRRRRREHGAEGRRRPRGCRAPPGVRRRRRARARPPAPLGAGASDRSLDPRGRRIVRLCRGCLPASVPRRASRMGHGFRREPGCSASRPASRCSRSSPIAGRPWPSPISRTPGESSAPATASAGS